MNENKEKPPISQIGQKLSIDRSYPLEKVVEAHQYVDSGRKKGNVILAIA